MPHATPDRHLEIINDSGAETHLVMLTERGPPTLLQSELEAGVHEFALVQPPPGPGRGQSFLNAVKFNQVDVNDLPVKAVVNVTPPTQRDLPLRNALAVFLVTSGCKLFRWVERPAGVLFFGIGPGVFPNVLLFGSARRISQLDRLEDLNLADDVLFLGVDISTDDEVVVGAPLMDDYTETLVLEQNRTLQVETFRR